MHITISTAALLASCGAAFAQAAPVEPVWEDPQTGVFHLGELTVVGERQRAYGQTSGQALSQDKATAQDIYDYNRNSLDDALTLIPGVSVDGFGGSRNEKVAYVRGFDLFQAPLSIDGVRVFLPYDNRLDLGRFITPDLAEIQVQKGYVSVLNGPGGMGGAINLVTRKPTKAVEGEARESIDFGNTGGVAAHTGFASLGTLQEKYYLQASAGYRDSDGAFLSKKFDPVSFGGVQTENGGRRDNADTRDWRVNLKAGFTPNDTDEYSISYTKQEGRKESPFSTVEPIRGVTGMAPGGTPAYQRNWRWPKWDYESVYFLSHTALGEKSYVDGKVFYNQLDNLLSAYDDGTFGPRVTGRSFDSYYNETGYGGSVELGTELIPMNTLKGAIHWRRDDHKSRNLASPDVNSIFDETVREKEDTTSFAVENTFHATDRLDLVGGVSYDRRSLKKADDPDLVDSGVKNADHAWNWQAAAIYKLTDTARIHASVSDRTRFPTLWERFSTRFGVALPNAGLKAERARNYEIGWADTVMPGVNLAATAFYSDVKDVIQGVNVGELVQNQNVGDGKYYGVELKADWTVNDKLIVGGHYTYLHREIDGLNGIDVKPVGTPKHYAMLYAKWEAYPRLQLIPSLELSSSRYSSDRFETSYTKNDGFALANFSAEYRVTDNFTTGVGVRNIFDKNYEVQYGYPEAGRSFFVQAKATF
ncbi:TonB-dependent receptor plug domain-containing protein [Hansschlegelia plantiphila]|uniref:TonB-dependent receptor plug domain-containing protein n=1 Tax=Hansschlegelia plantiphila TaxID=374655 RepID=UPI0022F27A28|nr:TonB-dependent receptor [Hansschlegelia plantiphila]